MFMLVHDSVMEFLDHCVSAVTNPTNRSIFNKDVKETVKEHLGEIVYIKGHWVVDKTHLIKVVLDVARKDLKGTVDLTLILSNIESYYARSFLIKNHSLTHDIT